MSSYEMLMTYEVQKSKSSEDRRQEKRTSHKYLY